MNQQPQQLDSLRKASHQAAIISALGAVILFTTLGISVWQLKHLEDKQQQLKQENIELQTETDSRRAEIASLDKQISVLREQKKGLLVDYRSDTRAVDQIPIEFAVRPYADAVHTGEYYRDGSPKRRYTLWLEIPPGRKREIQSVDYFFNHPTFTEQHMAGDVTTPGFKISYLGWGCMRHLVITLKLRNGKEKELDFDMCESILG